MYHSLWVSLGGPPAYSLVLGKFLLSPAEYFAVVHLSLLPQWLQKANEKRCDARLYFLFLMWNVAVCFLNSRF